MTRRLRSSDAYTSFATMAMTSGEGSDSASPEREVLTLARRRETSSEI
jgi:hypothetical protein